jgi:hypothetical protein
MVPSLECLERGTGKQAGYKADLLAADKKIFDLEITDFSKLKSHFTNQTSKEIFYCHPLPHAIFVAEKLAASMQVPGIP